jgi:hypothetical protein
MEKNIDITLYFLFPIFFSSIQYSFNLFLDYCKYYIIANMDFANKFFGGLFFDFYSSLTLQNLNMYIMIC